MNPNLWTEKSDASYQRTFKPSTLKKEPGEMCLITLFLVGFKVTFEGSDRRV